VNNCCACFTKHMMMTYQHFDVILGWTLYPPSTPHFTRAAHLPHPSPKRARLWGVHWHRTDWCLLGCTPRIHLKRSSLRSFRDMIIILGIYTLLFTTSRWKVWHQPGVSPYPSCLYLYAPVLLSFFTKPMRLMREPLPRLG